MRHCSSRETASAADTDASPASGTSLRSYTYSGCCRRASRVCSWPRLCENAELRETRDDFSHATAVSLSLMTYASHSNSFRINLWVIVSHRRILGTCFHTASAELGPNTHCRSPTPSALPGRGRVGQRPVEVRAKTIQKDLWRTGFVSRSRHQNAGHIH